MKSAVKKCVGIFKTYSQFEVQRNILPPYSSTPQFRQHVHPKECQPPSRLHSVMTQKATIWMSYVCEYMTTN